MNSRVRFLASILLVAVAAPVLADESAAVKPAIAGPSEQGFLLPNGWRISPAGKQVPLADLPLKIITSADD